MATLVPLEASQFHPGEREMQRLMRVPARRDNPTVPGLSGAHGRRVAASPLVAVGTLDRRGRPWASVWGGEAGFCRPVPVPDESGSGGGGGLLLGFRLPAVDARFDPVLWELCAVVDDDDEGEKHRRQIVSERVVQHEGGGKVMAGLSIDLETRDRVKLAGRMVGGCVAATEPGLGELQMAMAVDEALGNCPKYLNRKRISPRVPRPALVGAPPMDAEEERRRRPAGSESRSGSRSGSGSGSELGNNRLLCPEAVDLVGRADLFFIATKHGAASMDVNHRGGPAGFVRLLHYRDQDDPKSGGSTGTGTGTGTGTALIYPEYSGNRLYQTLGNLRGGDPCAGLVFPDFATGDVLYLTGRAEVLVGDRAAAYLPRTGLAVRVDVEEARFVRQGLGFRGFAPGSSSGGSGAGAASPYNPPVRRLLTEQQQQQPTGQEGGGSGVAVARLLDRRAITPTIARYTFAISPAAAAAAAAAAAGGTGIPAWRPGQHVTLDFGGELDHGWSHMRDDDPQSLNDDFVRTFTVSNALAEGDTCAVTTTAAAGGGGGEEPAAALVVREGAEPRLDITVRRHGPATALLARWNLRAPLELPVLGFGGEEAFRLPVRRRRDRPEAEGQKGGSARAVLPVFVAAGVGITPIMAQAAGVLGGGGDDGDDGDDDGDGDDEQRRGRRMALELVWSLKAEDAALAVQVLRETPGLGPATRLFVTGGDDAGPEQAAAALDAVRGLGAGVCARRVGRADVLSAAAGRPRKFYCCTGPGMMKELLGWLAEEDVVFESFEY